MSNPIKVRVQRISDIAPEKRFLVDELKIYGKFFAKTDSAILKSMCNTIVDGKRTGGHLSIVDLAECEMDILYGFHPEKPLDWGDFKDCITLKEIILPNTIFLTTYNGGEAFSGCKSLEKIKCYAAGGKGYDKDGVLFTKTNYGVSLMKFPANRGKEYRIPQETEYIAKAAFEDCQLTRLTMPPVPPTCHIDAFKGVNIMTITLVVPKGSHDSYWLHPVFGKFQIEEMDK